ncbi:carcinoembryonic antigen-related cell adhesion molecule 5-like isoform X1 [Cavia porcellus]|uniref:carcinoembryonic antigen-related cell adhesion molecule 5-like isoform X1 n=1 Tax=Cavia porcellus TaxID=10141 RepID=UPI002FE2F653
MERRTATSYRGFVPWQGLLLTASLLTFWSPPTTAQLTIESVPFDAVEGADVLLVAHNLPENVLGYSWFKGNTTASDNMIIRYVTNNNINVTGKAYSNRETIYRNGSLLIQNVTLQDSGFYTLRITDETLDTKDTYGQFHVHPILPKPYITVNNSSPVEGEEAIALTCEPETQNTAYLWWINGQSLQEGDRLKLSDGNRSLILLNVMRNDTGPYECETRNPVSFNRSDPAFLNISYGPDAPIISPPESYFRRGTNLSLSCHADSNPPVQYSWLVNGSLLQSTQELSIPNISVDDSGSYTCLVSNPATGLNTSTVKDITVIAPVMQPFIQASNTIITENDSVVLTCLSNDTGISIQWIINNQDLQLSEGMKLSEKDSILTIHPVKIEDAGEYQCEVSNPVSSYRSHPLRLDVFRILPKPYITVNNSSPLEGEEAVALTCEPETQNTTYMWWINGQSLQEGDRLKLSDGNRSLILLNVTRNDTGPYECETRNPVAFNRSDPVSLNISYGPDAPIISPQESHFRQGTNLSLSCHADSNPPAQYFWLVNGSLLQSTQELSIPNISADDSGSYTCLVSNPATGLNRSTVKDVTVIAPVTKPYIHASNTIITEDDSVVLNCLSNDTGVSIQWIFNNQDLQLSEGMNLSENNSTLTIDPVKIEDAGQYQCEVSSSVSSNRSDTLWLQVFRILPKPYITVNNSSPLEGEEAVALTCEPETQDTTYLWWINGQSLQEGDRLKLSDGNRSLILLNVTRNDTGPYECETQNPVAFNRSDPVSLNISYGPDIPIISPPESYFRQGTNLSLSCHADSNPPVQYSWLVNGSLLQSTQELSIPNISADDSGSYTCLVSNPATGLNRSTVKDVTVIAPVMQPSIQASNTTVTEDDSVVLTCLSNDTDIYIQWIFSNQGLQLSERMKLSENNSILTIYPVKIEDAGEYQCEVSNLVSSRKSEPFRLSVTMTEKESSGLSVGAIVGIVIAAVAVVALIAGLAYFLFFSNTGRYAVLSTSSISSKALCHARERDSTFTPPSWGWISFSPS